MIVSFVVVVVVVVVVVFYKNRVFKALMIKMLKKILMLKIAFEGTIFWFKV